MPGTFIMAGPISSEGEVTALFAALSGPLRRYFRIIGLSRDDADEAVQETFLRLHQHLGNHGDRTNLRGWIFAVARNLARNVFKSGHRRRVEGCGDNLERCAAITDPGRTPEEQAIQGERMRRLRISIGRLSPQQRECVRLRAAGLKYREIAAVLGIGVSNVGELVQRAVAHLNEEVL